MVPGRKCSVGASVGLRGNAKAGMRLAVVVASSSRAE